MRSSTALSRPLTKPYPEPTAAHLLEDVGFLSSSLSPEDTGVDGAVIWCFAGEFTRREAHLGPRVLVTLGRKVSTDAIGDSVSVTLTSPPEILGTLPASVAVQAVAFVSENRGVLLEHWNGEIDTADVIERLQRV